MSKENVKLFFEEVEKDVELKDKFDEITLKYNESILNRLVEIGREEGFEFTNEELEAFNEAVILNMLEKDELSDGDLESASGGFNFDIDVNIEIRPTVIDSKDLIRKALEKEPQKLINKLF